MLRIVGVRVRGLCGRARRLAGLLLRPARPGGNVRGVSIRQGRIEFVRAGVNLCVDGLLGAKGDLLTPETFGEDLGDEDRACADAQSPSKEKALPKS